MLTTQPVRRDCRAEVQDPNSTAEYGKAGRRVCLIFGKEVTLHTYGLDKYGRTLAVVLLPDGTYVNHELVKNA